VPPELAPVPLCERGRQGAEVPVLREHQQHDAAHADRQVDIRQPMTALRAA